VSVAIAGADVDAARGEADGRRRPIHGLPLSISAGVGCIALFGVAVLDGLVLVGYIEERRRTGMTEVPVVAPQPLEEVTP